MKVGLDSLKNHAFNPTPTMATLLREELDKLVVLSFHCIVAEMIYMLCQKNMCAMSYVLAYSLHMYIYCVD